MKTKTGTSHFINLQKAIAYYYPQEGKSAHEAVKRKLAAGEIHLGAPKVKPGEMLFLDPKEGRYFIES